MQRCFFVFCMSVCVLGYAFPRADLQLVVSKEQIAEKIAEVGKVISNEYRDKNLILLVVMKGGICVAADLMRAIDIPVQLDYITASSYGYNGSERGELKVNRLDQIDIEGRDVLVVDDLFDSGNTLFKIKEAIELKHPNSVKTFSLLIKDIPRTMSYVPDYVLFHIPDLFVVGYGLDYKEMYRGLPSIYAIL